MSLLLDPQECTCSYDALVHVPLLISCQKAECSLASMKSPSYILYFSTGCEFHDHTMYLSEQICTMYEINIKDIMKEQRVWQSGAIHGTERGI